MKKLLLILFLFAFLVGCEKAEVPPEKAEMDTPDEIVTVNEAERKDEMTQPKKTKRSFGEILDKIKLLGRVYKKGEEIVTSWPGSGFEIRVKSDGGPFKIRYSVGKSEATLPYFNIYVDGALVERAVFKGNGKYFLELSEGEHTIALYRDSANSPAEACNFMNIDFEGDVLDKPENKERYIELIGDSISSGLGSLGQYTEDVDWMASEHSVSSSFGFYVAEEFDADISVIAKGGIGLLAASNGKTMLDLYPYVNGYLSDEKYSFERKPDLVIVALSANDSTKKYSDEQFEEALKEMYRQIFSSYG